MTPPARLFALDGDGGFKAAIWGGAFSARLACVVCRCLAPVLLARIIRFFIFFELLEIQ
jgi:hypothetical protein